MTDDGTYYVIDVVDHVDILIEDLLSSGEFKEQVPLAMQPFISASDEEDITTTTYIRAKTEATKIINSGRFREYMSFSLLDWRLAKEHHVHPSELTKDFLQAAIVKEVAEIDKEAAANGIRFTTPDEFQKGLEDFQKFTQRCVATGQIPPGYG